ncbi:MAG: hypothetical protein JXR97_06750 [Planctomycetes bacterium]|nr:hypothetical protein [Planctomycetota bacterium]
MKRFLAFLIISMSLSASLAICGEEDVDFNSLLEKAYDGGKVQIPESVKEAAKKYEKKDWLDGIADDSEAAPSTVADTNESVKESVIKIYYSLEETPVYREMVKSALKEWTLMGKPATDADYDMIIANIRKILEAEIRSGRFGDSEGRRYVYKHPEAYANGKERDGLGSVIYELTPPAGNVDWSYSGSARFSQTSWPLQNDSEDVFWSYPSGSQWYSAPAPWVIHTKAPFIGYYTPSPFYDNPWVMNSTIGDDGIVRGQWVNVWPTWYCPPVSYARPSYTNLGFVWDSGKGKKTDIDVRRPWGEVHRHDNDLDESKKTRGKNLRIGISFKSSDRPELAMQHIPGYGGFRSPYVYSFQRSYPIVWFGEDGDGNMTFHSAAPVNVISVSNGVSGYSYSSPVWSGPSYRILRPGSWSSHTYSGYTGKFYGHNHSHYTGGGSTIYRRDDRDDDHKHSHETLKR